MQLSILDQIIVVVYLAVIMSIGFAMKRKAAKGMSSYFLGGRQLPWWALAMSGSSSYFDITGTMWIVSTFIALGLKGMWVHWLWGFPITAFYLAYMGKWIRRSDAMTGAEWMKTRFGNSKAGDLARLSYTLFAVLTISALLGYSAIGMGKFGSIFLPFSPNVCALLILGVTGLYVILGGFHGIVRVEIIQTIVLSAGAIIFSIIGYLHFDAAAFASKVPSSWNDIAPHIRPEAFQGLVSGGTDYSFFGALVAVWVAKGLLLCLSGPEQLYDFQRFLAAKDERDASKLGRVVGRDSHCQMVFCDGDCGDGDYGHRQSRARRKTSRRPGNGSAFDYRFDAARRTRRIYARRAAFGIFGDVQFDRQRRRGVSRQRRLSTLHQSERGGQNADSGELRFVRAFNRRRSDNFVFRNFDQHRVSCGFSARSPPEFCRRMFCAGIGGV